MEHLISRGWYVLKTGAKKSNVKTFSSFSDFCKHIFLGATKKSIGIFVKELTHNMFFRPLNIK